MPLDFENQPTNFSGSSGLSSNTTPVTVVEQPTNGNNRRIKRSGLSVSNFDTGAVEVLIVRSGSIGGQIVDCVVLQPGDKWVNSSEIVLNNSENTLVLNLSQPVTSSQAVWNVSFDELLIG